ncbi:MAG: hypothetical protein A2W99_13515 [Bacteroidetes bacterium GWF2_33_16]|nr:MAG: hypothetical protein A2X00_08170 [Bacteroidetes bacterium GWE2_32_14]OFY06753.1 MAG: hypothetical protein A2W99_13515 [Bacteroidetes bacterium GWF2_33_16]
MASSCGQKVPTNLKLKNELDTISYCLGVDVANSLKRGKFKEINYEAFIKGMDDILTEKKTLIKQDTLKFIVNDYFRKLQEKGLQKNLEEGQKFMEENKKREGVTTTESGLQYEIITEGTGKYASDSSLVLTHYRGTLIDGTVFDSSYDRGQPIEIALNGVIKGWTEGLQLIKEGGKVKLYIPIELGYGVNVRPGGMIEPNMALIFEVELIEVKSNPKN